MSNDDLKTLREQLASTLAGGQSHITFDKVMKDFPAKARGEKPEGVPHSAWELVEHMRIAQRDILDFSRDPKHKSPKFPEGYWPKSATPPEEAAWTQTLEAFQEDAQALGRLIEGGDLFAAFAHGDGQNLLREALVAATHNSYHLGQLAFLKRMLTGKA